MRKASNSYRRLLLLIRMLELPHRDAMGEKGQQLPLVTAALIQARTAIHHLQLHCRKSIQIRVLLSTCRNAVEGVLISAQPNSSVAFLIPSYLPWVRGYTPACLLFQVAGFPEYLLNKFEDCSFNAHVMLSDCNVMKNIHLKSHNSLQNVPNLQGDQLAQNTIVTSLSWVHWLHQWFPRHLVGTVFAGVSISERD